MIQNPKKLIEHFILSIHGSYKIDIKTTDIIHECKPAPHKPPDLVSGMGAVYVFSLNNRNISPAGPNRPLKVGKVGPNSNARFKYQHYKIGSAQSTLAGSLLQNPHLWSYLQITNAIEDFGSWLQNNTDRDHFFIDGINQKVISILESYLKGVLGPVFEG